MSYSLPIALSLLLLGCGDPIERQIEHLVAGGEAAEDAKMELNLAKSAAAAPLIKAFQTPSYPPRARADLA